MYLNMKLDIIGKIKRAVGKTQEKPPDTLQREEISKSEK